MMNRPLFHCSYAVFEIVSLELGVRVSIFCLLKLIARGSFALADFYKKILLW